MWQKLSRREQILIIGAAALFAILLLVLTVIRPVMTYHEEAAQNLQQADTEYRAIARLADMRQRAVDADQAKARRQVNQAEGQSPRIIISTSARNLGIVVSRIRPAENGSLTLWMDSVASITFYSWLKTLESDYNITPELVSLQKNADASLRAQVQFAGVQ